MASSDVVVIGGGIVGLALADAWLTRHPGSSVIVLDKEAHLAAHASGRNSGVLHAGFYYAPDSLKAQCRKAVEFCDAKGVDIAKLALQFCLQHPDIATTVPGTANPDNMAKQLQWLDEPGDHGLIAEVMQLLEPTKNVLWRVGRQENNVDWDAGL